MPPSSPTSTSGDEVTWTPTADARKKAMMFRIIAADLWVLALGGEALAGRETG